MERHYNFDPVTYNLQKKSHNHKDFYENLRECSNQIQLLAKYHIGIELDDYHNYTQHHQLLRTNHKEESLIDLLLLSALWNNHYSASTSSYTIFYPILEYLSNIRNKNQKLKPLIDAIRGVLTTFALDRNSHNTEEHFTIKEVIKLKNWLNATNEYINEVKRIESIVAYLHDHSSNITTFLSRIIAFEPRFTKLCRSELGYYTQNVNRFITHSSKQNRYNENYFFTSRPENEYFLNMVGAQLLNNCLTEPFSACSEIVILLPTCMRSNNSINCKSVTYNGDRECVGCSDSCNIGLIKRVADSTQTRVLIMPHTSGFNQLIRKWEGSNTGIIGVACVLNLLSGGYSMMNLGIASQCVFLDYGGCKKHWTKNGIDTILNTKELQRILSQAEGIGISRSEVA